MALARDFNFALCLIVTLLLVELQCLPIEDNGNTVNQINDEKQGNRVGEGFNTLIKYPELFLNDFITTLNNGISRFRGFIKPGQNSSRNKRSIAVEDLAQIFGLGRDDIQSIASQFDNPVDGIENNVQDVGEFMKELLTFTCKDIPGSYCSLCNLEPLEKIIDKI